MNQPVMRPMTVSSTQSRKPMPATTEFNDSQSRRLPAFLMGCNVRDLRDAVRTLYRENDFPPNLAGTVGEIDRQACEVLGRSADEDAHRAFHDLLDNFLTLYHVEEIPANDDIFGRLRDAVEGRLAEVEVSCWGLVEVDPALAAWCRLGYAMRGLIAELGEGIAVLPRRAEVPCLLPRELMGPIREAVRSLPVNDRAIVEEVLPKLQPWDEGNLAMELSAAVDRIRGRLGDECESPVELDDPGEAGGTEVAPSPAPGADAADEGQINPNGDWSVVVASHGTYYLTDTAASCFKVMFEASKRGIDPRASEVVRVVDVEDRRVDHIFSRCGAWASDNSGLVGPSQKGRRGRYQINL
jgi:hypothetical protein